MAVTVDIFNAYQHAYLLGAYGDEIRLFLNAIEEGEYKGTPKETPFGTFSTGAPVTTDEDREKVRQAIHDRLRKARSSLVAIEAATGVVTRRGGIER